MILRFVEVLKKQIFPELVGKKGDFKGREGYCFFSLIRFELFHFGAMERIFYLKSEDLDLRPCRLSINLSISSVATQ